LGSLGAASSESAAGSGRLRACGCRESAAVSVVAGRAVALTCGLCVSVLASLDGCEVRLCDPCALVRPRVPCVSRVCPGSPGVFLPVPVDECDQSKNAKFATAPP